jgi:phospholipase C
MFRRAFLPLSLTAMTLALAACGGDNNNAPPAAAAPAATVSSQDALATATPIKHLVVIYGENRSFDHYFGTYPNATNPTGEPQFVAAAGTPAINGLSGTLLTANPNTTNAANLALLPAIPVADFNPFRIDRAQVNTAGQNHSYTPEQAADDGGLMDAFPANTGNGTAGGAGVFGTKATVMGYFDGNTVTGLWNYAQHFAMNDNAYTGTFGPSTPGALEAISGQTNGVVLTTVAGVVTPGTSPSPTGNAVADGAGGFTLIGDLDPTNDVCTNFHNAAVPTTVTAALTSKNIGDLLNTKGITWGGFMGGFNLQLTNANGTTACNRSTFSSVLNSSPVDYTQHHAWFQYYASTANLAHTRPTSTAVIGATDPLDSTATPVHHQYDTQDFFTAVTAGNFPSVSFLKAPAVEDAHPGNSDPLDEQVFVTKVVNFLEQQPDWKNTAVIITYDDSDGWYDHRFAPPTAISSSTADVLSGANLCTSASAVPAIGVNGGAVNGRCGPGTRIPFVVISPWAKANFVDDTQVTQASISKFIEDNWLGGTRLGQGSFDATAGSINNMFNFAGTGNNPTLFLDGNLGTVLTATPPLPTSLIN